MNFEAGIRFIVFLVIFGVTNYLMMLRRYENDKENTPSFLAGPFTQNIPNPIGSFSAILILLLLCIFYTVNSKKIFTRRFN